MAGPLGAAAIGLGAIATSFAAYGLAVAPAREASRLGARGLKRQQAIGAGSLFSIYEPLVRWLGTRVSGLLPERLWRVLDAWLVRSGDYLGITPDECVVLIALGAVAGAVCGGAHALFFDYGPTSWCVGAALGAYAALRRFDAEIERRARELTHGLPYVTDLLALGMTAGLDFPSAVRNVVERSSDRRDGLTEELERILRELAVGHTRRSALEQLAARARVPAVTEFVYAVVQAEERGTPLVEVFTIQAKVARQKRTALAEERTERAHVAMVLPLTLLLISTTLVIVVPLVLRTTQILERLG